MKYSWLKTVFPIAAIFSFRMLGLFMLIPVFTVLASHLEGATATLTGFALGGYGLTQGLLQMPFGMLSDRFGRKPILTLGLLLFALGSLLGALSHSIYTIILARVLQGMGAIGSVLIALVADLTVDELRTKAMAVIGMTIGLSFSLAMVLSPTLTHWFGLEGIFYFTAFLALLGLLLLHFVIPTPSKECFHVDTEANLSLFKTVISNKDLQRLNLGIFFQHFILTATFYAIPILLHRQMAEGHLSQQWHFYLPLMLFSFLFMIPFIFFAEKRQHMKMVFASAVFLTSLMQFALLLLYQHWLGLWVTLFLYFVAFNILEATLPSLISKQAHPGMKGTAMGVYSSSQFLGIFLGGACAGILYRYGGHTAIFFTNACAALGWFLIALFMRTPRSLSTLILPYHENMNNLTAITGHLRRLAGVTDLIISDSEKIIYLQVDKNTYQNGSAANLMSKI
jgi:MFS family permease